MIGMLFEAIDSIKINWTISIGDIIAFATILIGIYQFNKQAKLSRKEKDLTQRETWFLNVIVEPQLPLLDEFYQALIKEISKQRNDLSSCSQRLNNNTFLNKIAKYKRENKEKIAARFNHLEALVRSYSGSLAGKLSDYVILLQDICVDLLDRYSEQMNNEAIQIRILRHQQAVLSLLNKGLTINKY